MFAKLAAFAVAAVVAALVSFVSPSSAEAANRCGSGAFDAGTKRILILDCPKNYLGVGANVTYVTGVPGQDSLIAHGIILLQNSSAPNGCLWPKKIDHVNNGYKFRGKVQDVNYVVKPAKGVLRPEGGISYNTDSGRVAAFEMRPGACDGRKSIPMTIDQLIKIRH